MKNIILIIAVLWLTGCASTLRPISNATHGDILEAGIYQQTATPTPTISEAVTAVPTMAPAIEQQPQQTATPRPIPTAVPRIVTHIVQHGDTLSKIARHYNVTVDQIVRHNNITNPNLISVGQELVIRLTPQGNEGQGMG